MCRIEIKKGLKMKKLILLFAVVLFAAGCSLDEGDNMVIQYSEVSDIDLPEFFEEGKTYEIEVTYLLPSGCHTAAGIDVRRSGNIGDESRKIYIAGLSNFNADAGECSVPNTNPEKTAKYNLNVTESQPYTFYLWKRVDAANEPVFTIVEVPVGDPSGGETAN